MTSGVYGPLIYGPLILYPLASTFQPGQRIQIAVPVTSRSTADVRVKVTVRIYEGSILPGAGTQLAEYTSPEQSISPNQTRSFAVQHTTVRGTIDRRDVGAEVWYWDGSRWVKDGTAQWDDVYYVRAPAYQFEIGAPTVTEV